VIVITGRRPGCQRQSDREPRGLRPGRGAELPRRRREAWFQRDLIGQRTQAERVDAGETPRGARATVGSPGCTVVLAVCRCDCAAAPPGGTGTWGIWPL